MPTPLPAGLPHTQEDAGEEKALFQGVGRCAGQSVPRPCHGVKVPERLAGPKQTAVASTHSLAEGGRNELIRAPGAVLSTSGVLTL